MNHKLSKIKLIHTVYEVIFTYKIRCLYRSLKWSVGKRGYHCSV